MVWEARIYSLASNSWKNLGFVPYCFPFSVTKGVLLNGVLHWIATGLHDDPESAVIVCFDISDETFYDVPLPPCDFDHHCLPYLGVWEGKLCLLHQIHMEEDPDISCKHQNDHIDVWTMMNNKWSKHSQITALVTEMKYIRPIQTLPNAEILFEGESRLEAGFHLISYDPKLERARALNIQHGFHESPGPEVDIYIETLVALNSGTYVRKIEMEWKGLEEVPGWCGEFGKRKAVDKRGGRYCRKWIIQEPNDDILERVFKKLEAYSVSSSVSGVSLESLDSETYVGRAEKEDSEDVVGLGWFLSDLWPSMYRELWLELGIIFALLAVRVVLVAADPRIWLFCLRLVSTLVDPLWGWNGDGLVLLNFWRDIGDNHQIKYYWMFIWC
ncbi:hypothetical protein C5167_003605 [Papaver somniferum]|uniref:F-box associated beta-propeller type 1 domain-containing protein n=1 Tax=Papaver somniferum TaxID=3469 RepID=A0A4Y7L5E9_PAPSO|nr:hypothetical protein C5167_003605 [Papaver somniferum]